MPLSRGGGAPPRPRRAARAGARRRLGSVAAALVALAGCGRRSTGQPLLAASASASPRAVAPASAPAAAPDAPAPGPPGFEVEFEGRLRGGPAAERHVVLVTTGPCTVDSAATAATIAIGEGRTRAGVRQFWTEGNVREGTEAHVCALALDRDGRLIGFGAYGRNPLRLSAGGKAELEVDDLDITLSPVSPPRPLPPDRY